MSTILFQSDERGLVLNCPQCGKLNRMSYERLGQTFRCGNCHFNLPSVDQPIEVNNENVFEAFTSRSAMTVIVDFWAPWCGPCKMVAPELAKVADQNAGRWIIAKVNTEELPGVAQRFQIQAIPTLAVFKNGREVGRKAGALPAAAIEQFVKQIHP